MIDQDCVRLLKWALPKLHMRWNGFRRVRGQVCKRIDRRMHELDLPDEPAYRAWLGSNETEWAVLDSLCRVTISRFYRDREVFRALEHEVLLRLCETAVERGDSILRCWSIGCASGEEPYTLALLWDRVIGRRYPSLSMTILATDADKGVLERAQDGCYSAGSLRELPEEWKPSFMRKGDRFCVKTEAQRRLTFLEQDIRTEEPEGKFHLIFCRNLVFTYFDHDLQNEILARLQNKLLDHGVLVLGAREQLPSTDGMVQWPGCRSVYRKK
jgi:chemotaxis protein methyltransferase CheR